MSAFSRDLLPNLTSKIPWPQKFKDEQQQEDSGETEEIELTLGLSMNGRFGVDPAAKKLTRSSSIPDFLNPSMEPLPPASLLMRTCSLPVETEEELRKRKEIQSLRRLEAKRKRTEKQRNSKGGHFHQQEQSVKALNWVPVGGSSPQQPQTLSHQGSIGSQGSGRGSSGISESESLLLQGMMKSDGSRSPTSPSSIVEGGRKLLTSHKSRVDSKKVPFNGQTISPKEGMEMVRNVLDSMPCVSTRGEGPNGKRIEGFLYRYRKGEEVRIVCVCHGNFLSPAEFVRHAGGGDVAHPLRHIVVNHSPLL